MRQAPTSLAIRFGRELSSAFSLARVNVSAHRKSILWSVAAILTFFGLWAGAWYAYKHNPTPASTLSATNTATSESHAAKAVTPTTYAAPLASTPSASTPSLQTPATNNSSTDPSEDKHASVSVTVNGQPVSVPQNGSTHKVIVSPSGKTSVNISSNSSTSTNSGGNNVSTNLEVHTQTISTDSSVP